MERLTNIVDKYFGVAWCSFITGVCMSDIGEMTTGPKEITWFVAIACSVVWAWIPFILGRWSKGR